jgi:hypothetical protein
MRKHKYIWTTVLAVTLLALAGLASARGGLIGSHAPAGSAASSQDDSGGCPLQWLKSLCCGGN